MNFVKIPGKDYEFQTTLVTQEQWKKVMRNNPSYFKGKPNLPVEQVSFHDCMEFINRLNKTNDGYVYRLPTEKEWEQACRAETTTDYYFPEKDIDDYCWYNKNSDNKTHPIGLKKPNAYGLYDMSGLLYEWSASLYGSTGSIRVLRGGSWDDLPVLLRSAFRLYARPGFRISYVGLRLLREKVNFDSITLDPSESERAKLREALREFKKKRPTFGEVQAFKLGFKKGMK